MSSKHTSHGFITGEQQKVLCAIAEKPGSIEALNTRACNALERRGLVELEVDAVTLTHIGKIALQECGAPKPIDKVPKVRGGGRRKPHGAAKARTERPAAPASKGSVLAELRRIRAEVAAKLKALDEAIEIVEAVA